LQEYFENIIEELQEEIRELTIEVDDPIRLSEQAIKISWDKLQKVKAYVLNNPFSNPEEEIWIF